MSIAPIVQSVTVAVPPSRAFDLFVGSIGTWWPGKTIGAEPHVAIVIEPYVGGRWFERDAAGVETDWGCVLAWEHPDRLVLGWQLDASFRFNPDVTTEVVMTFEDTGQGTTSVTLTHQHLERLGVDAARVAEQLRGGWPSKVAGFADFANALEKAA